MAAPSQERKKFDNFWLPYLLFPFVKQCKPLLYISLCVSSGQSKLEKASRCFYGSMILYFSILSRYFYDLFYVEGGKRVKEMEKTNGKKGGKG